MSGVAIVTGASRGIGAATALLLGRSGYAVCVNYLRSAEAAQGVVDAIERDGGRAVARQADVSVESEVERLFAFVDDALGRVTALVNNAGVLEKQARVANIDAARLHRIFSVNVVSCFVCAREGVRRMALSAGGDGGAIVNVSSIAARTGAAGEYVDYAASKGAIDALTIGLAKEVAADGVRVNAVRPAFIYTDIHASGGEPGRVDRVKGSVPMRRGGHPDEVAEAIAWLLSDKASYVTGALIDMAGGV